MFHKHAQTGIAHPFWRGQPGKGRTGIQQPGKVAWTWLSCAASFLLEVENSLLDRPFIIMEYIQGEVMWDLLGRTPADRHRALDFAKFGRLFLNDGNWNGVQVVPAQWMAESTQADTSVDYAHYYPDDFIFANGQGYYKYMWWGIQRSEKNYDFMALGNHGQFIYISPQKNLIILRFGESYGEYGGAQGWLDLFYGFVSRWEK